jgi:hypothetical protein
MGGRELQYKLPVARPRWKPAKITEYHICNSLNRMIKFEEFVVTFSSDSFILPSPTQIYNFIHFKTMTFGLTLRKAYRFWFRFEVFAADITMTAVCCSVVDRCQRFGRRCRISGQDSTLNMDVVPSPETFAPLY